MKICKKCGKLLDKRAFNKNIHRPDGLQDLCRMCECTYVYHYKKHHPDTFRYQEDLVVKYLGGYKINILNHIKEGEFRYNISSTDGKFFGTQDKEEFLSFLNNILKQF